MRPASRRRAGIGKEDPLPENWVYLLAVAKEREILAKSGGQILRITGGGSHSGSHSPYYSIWSSPGGGAFMGKACHPVGAALHLKRVEDEAHRRAIQRLRVCRSSGEEVEVPL